MHAVATLLAALTLAVGASPELVSTGPGGPGGGTDEVVLSGDGRFAA